MKQVADIDTYRREFTPEEINAYPLKRWRGPVRVVNGRKKAKAAVAEMSGESVLGFDTETRPVFKKGMTNPISLLQLATSDTVYIFQLASTPLFPELTEILSDESIIKAGVSVRDDIIELKKLHEFEPAGFTDLGDAAAEHGLKTRGLRNLAVNLLGFRISKGQRCTNWAKPDLSSKQVEYAATDAWVGRELYLRMRELGLV
jgi:ribonuclease D